MRISDWSSDVCSSDLADEIGRSQQPLLRSGKLDIGFGAALLGQIAAPRQDPHLERAREPRHLESHPAESENAERGAPECLTNDCCPAAGQIGRASCRERVCKYG